MAEYDVVLLPTFAQVEQYRKQQVTSGEGMLFACAVNTFPAWIAELWELHGDGRAIVDNTTRLALMQHVLADYCGSEGAVLVNSPGMAALAARCVKAAAGVGPFEDALARVRACEPYEGLAPSEYAFLKVLARYSDALSELGFVEFGHACAQIARQSERVFPAPLSVLVEHAAPLSWQQQMLFEACPAISLTVHQAAGAAGIERAPENLEVQFAFPSGQYASAGLIAEIVSDAREHGAVPVAISCADPLNMHARLHDALAELGVGCAVRARVPFASTDFGRTFLSLVRALHANPFDIDALADAVASPFSGFSQADAYEIAKQLRADRIAVRDECLATLRAANDTFSQLEEVASDPEADILLGVFEQLTLALGGRSDSWRAQQLASISQLREVTRVARACGMTIKDCIPILDQLSVPVSFADAPAGAEDAPCLVSVASQRDVASGAVGDCATLVVADLSADAYPVADREDAASTLLSKLGLENPDDALFAARRTFNALVAMPSSKLVLMRPLHDANADPSYPCAVFEEFVDAYRADPTSTDDLDDVLGIPEPFSGQALTRGEELLFANESSSSRTAAQACTELGNWPEMGEVPPAKRGGVLLTRYTQSGVGLGRPSPSPSQVEAYLECPYQWFATRRLHIDTLDEEFGPLERGSFAHAALERFYQQFQQQVAPKVTPETLEQARAIMREVLEQLAAEQPLQEPKSGRLVTCTQLEERELAAFKEQIVSFLDFEAQLLPTFHPAYFEYQIDADHAVDYAGCKLVGIVDRIDVDNAGNAVIIDYKGSVGNAHAIGGKTREWAGKVQTRIYAQAIKRALGLNVVGALYISYGNRPAVSGAYDPRVLDAAHLPNVKAEACACGLLDEPLWADAQEPEGQGASGAQSFADFTFPVMLDQTEELVAHAVESMLAGVVAPHPSNSDSCRYCPVASCPERSLA